MKSRPLIPYARQSIGIEERRALSTVIQSDRITQGPEIEAFEKEVARYAGARFAVAVTNGTAALHLACLAIGLTPGDEVVTTSLSFLASSNCVLYAGAKPVFADIDPSTFCLSPKAAEKKIGRRTKAILAVDMAGHPCDIDAFRRLAKRKGLFFIEDASHSFGASYKGRHVGGLADMTTLSFHPVKTITTGEGGMILTQKRDLYEKLLVLRNHGIVREPSRFVNKAQQRRPDPWYYEMQALGFNYRITDLQCAIGRAQLTKIDRFVARRNQIAAFYNRAFAGLDWLRTPSMSPGVRSAWHLYVARIDFRRIGQSRSSVFAELNQARIAPQVHYIPIHRQPYYRKNGFGSAVLPETDAYYECAVSLPLFPDMTKAEINRVISAVRRLAHR